MGYNRKLLSEISNKLSQRKDLAKPKDIIKDPEGQWKFPGQPTRIPSSNITMKGVPYPVLGVASTGQKQMMYPNQEYQFPGAEYVDEFPPDKDAMNAMMKARLAYANEFGNPAAQRMITLPDNLYDFGDGNMGSHYMASMDNYAVPQIQDVNGKLVLGDFGPESNEAIRFDRPEDAEYFAEHYKDVSPAFIEAELTDEEIEEYKKGGYIIEELPEAQEGGISKWWEETASEAGKKIGEWGQKILEEAEAKKAAEENDFPINLEGLKKGIAHVESADGVLMKNPNSSATGLYGQLFSEQGMSDLYSGTRDEFAKDIDAQNRIFEIRLNQGIGGNALIQDAKDLKKEYAPQIKDFNKMFSNEDIIVLDNFLGRQGTRKYFGNVIRDGKSLAEVFPHLYGKDVAAPNHTPEVYLSKARSYYKKQDDGKLGGWFGFEEALKESKAKEKQDGGELGGWFIKVLKEKKAKEEEDAAYERWLDQNLGPKKEEKTYTYVDPITNKTVERSYNDKQLLPAATRQVDPEKLKTFINSVDLTKAAKELAETAYQFTVAPAVRTGERIIDDPLQFVKDVGTTVVDIAELPAEGLMTIGSKLFGDDNNYVDVNTDALGVTADVIGSLPVAGVIGKGAKPLVKTGLKYADDVIYPTRVYRASTANKNVKNLDYGLSGNAEKIAYEKGLKSKINKKGKFYTKDLEELSQYLKGNEGRRGLFLGDDMIIDEVKLPFFKKNILSDKDVVALKQSQGAVLPGQPRGLFDQVINENEFLIPNKSIFYPRKSTVIKGMPQEISTRPVYVRNHKGDIVDISGEFSPSTPFTYDSPAYSNQSYKYLEDQINAATGHNIPLYNPNPLQEHTLLKNYVQPANPGASFNFNKVKEFFNRPPGPLMLLGPNQGGNRIKKNMNYYKQLLDTYDTRKMSTARRKYYNNLINTGKKQDGMVTEAQLRELNRLKTGDFNFGKKGYASGGFVELDLTPEEIQQYVDGGYVVEELPQAQDGLTVADVEAILSGNAPIQSKQSSLSPFIAKPEDQVEPVIKQALKNIGIDYSKDDEIIKNMPIEKSRLDKFLEGAPDIAEATGEALLNTVSTTGEALQNWAKEHIYDPISMAISDQPDMPRSKEEKDETSLGAWFGFGEDSAESKAKEEEPFSNQRFSTPEIEKEIFSRQEQDNRRYGKFMSKGKNIANRTDVKRNFDSEIFFADTASPNSVIIDIGSALGNTNPKLAGISVYELTQNPKIKDKKIKVIATDIPEQVETFKKHSKDKKAFDIDYAEVPKTFNTPIDTILKSKNLTNKKDIYLRAANSIDLLMNPAQTREHFDHIAKTLKNKNVTYVFNNVILFKPAGKSTFNKLGNINNAAYDHKSASWKINKDRKPYTLL